MINNTVVQVDYIDQKQQKGTIELVLTGDQIEATMRRRLNTLMPGTRLINMQQVHQQELNLSSSKTK